MFSKLHTIFDSLTNIERKVFQGALLVFLVSLILNGANAFYKTTSLQPIKGGRYVEGVVGQPIALNPLIAANNEVDQDLIEIIYSDITELSETITLSDDKLVWTVKLKHDLLWSDGQPITADDVIFTLERIQNPETRSGVFATWQSVVAQKLSVKEIRFTLKTPYAFFLDNLSTLKIAPQHIFGIIPSANLRLSDYNFEPVGSGPYTVTGYEKQKDGFIHTYHLTTNENYHENKPLIQDLTFKFYPTFDAAITAFNKKEIDGLGGLSVSDLERLKIGHHIKEVQIPRYYAVFLNQNTSLPLKDNSVRKALSRATNKATMVSDVLDKHGIISHGPILPNIEGYDASLETTSAHSLEQAAEILEERGWIKGEDGIREKEISGDMVRLSFEIIVPDIDFLVATASILESDWKNIGVELIPIIMSPAEVINSAIRNRNYQMLIFGNILKDNPDVFSFWHSSERFRPGLNLSLYDNQNVDGILEGIRRNFEVESRIENIKLLQEYITEDNPAIFLYSPLYLYAAPKNLGGFTTAPITTPANRFDVISEWYLKTARAFK
jgi:peptide/nickel transport system substrate-binding protein